MTLTSPVPLRVGIVALVYRAEIRFSLLPEFLDHLAIPLDLTVAHFDEVMSHVRSAAERLRTGTPTDRVVARDLDALIAATPTESVFTAAHGLGWADVVSDPELSLDLTRKRVEEVLAEVGLALPNGGRPRVVDDLPAVRDLDVVAAMVVDAEDERVFGFEPGVYMRRSSLRPIYSDFLYCHELVHALLGAERPDLVAHGLEEGIADFIGALWLSGKILGPEETQRLFILNRLSHSYDPYWERYLDSARYWLSEYLAGGLPRVLDALRAGREGLLLREEAGWQGKGELATFRASDDDAWLGPLARNLLLRFPRASVVSARAMLFAEHALDGLTVVEIGSRAGLTRDDAVAAAAELRDDLALIYVRADGIVVLDAKPARVLSTQWLRYRIAGNG